MIRWLVVLIAITTLLVGCGSEKQGPSPQIPAVMTEGSPARDFTLKTAEGKTITLSGLRGKPVVINFWASWCPPCRKEMPVLKNAAGTYDGKVQFVGVNLQDSQTAFREALAEFGLPYPNGRDEDVIISQAYGVTVLPRTFFINKDGIISYIHTGAIDEATLAAVIQKISS